MIDKILLFPYYLTLKIRNWRYDSGRAKSVPAEVPTISVGNITVGGTGKTPHTEMILRELLADEKWGAKNIAVLSRGYKRESRGFQQVTSDGSAAMFGDEPLQIKKNFPGVTVVVDKNRVEACDFLCHPEKLQTAKGGRKCWNKNLPAADMIILDDAFQFRKLTPNLSIVLVDYNRPIHKDKLLPFGNLRDLKERIGEPDIIIVTKCPYDLNEYEKTNWAETLGIQDFDTSSCSGTGIKGKRQTVLFSYINYSTPLPIYPGTDSRYIYSKRVILFTGIAKDKPLISHLSDSYKIVNHFNFPDHHKYGWGDFHKIQIAARNNPTAAIATTEKDAQRVLDYNGLPPEMKERMLMIPIKVKFLTDAESDLFRSIITAL